jgi:hypothetical protein
MTGPRRLEILRKHVWSLTVALALTTSCDRRQDTPPSADEMALARQIGLSDSALAIIRKTARGPLGELRPLDSLGDLQPARGVSFGLGQSKTQRTIARLRERLGPGYLVFTADQGFGMTPDSIGIIASKDQFDILRVRNTDGINYDIPADSVLALALMWDRQYGLEITGAGMDWFEARFIRPPADWLAFAKELYAICPDIVDQGTESVEALAAEMRRSNTLYCWWD